MSNFYFFLSEKEAWIGIVNSLFFLSLRDGSIGKPKISLFTQKGPFDAGGGGEGGSSPPHQFCGEKSRFGHWNLVLHTRVGGVSPFSLVAVHILGAGGGGKSWRVPPPPKFPPRPRPQSGDGDPQTSLTTPVPLPSPPAPLVPVNALTV